LTAARTLLPPNALPLERALDAVIASRFASWPVAIDQLKDPGTAPAEVLPFLAWEWSVDTWQSEWVEHQKRAVIAAAIDVHRHKGTVGAVRRAVAAQGVEVTLTEWHQTGTPPYTFAVEAETEESLSADKQRDIMAAIYATKNVRSHLSSAKFYMRRSGAVPRFAGLTMGGAVTTVYPPVMTAVSGFAGWHYASALSSFSSIAIYPGAL
jgi:phage tail P2-like protein